MATQIKKKFIQNDAIDGDKILLESNQTLRKKDGMGGEVDILADITSDIAQNANDISNEISRATGEETAIRGEFASADAALQTEIDAAEVRLDSVETTLPLKADLVGGLVPTSQLPSFVDDVEEYADLASFPVTGEMSKIYVALDTNKAYRWSGSMYIQITSGAVDTVNGQNGVVVLDAADISMVSEATTIEDKLISLQNEIDTEEAARIAGDLNIQEYKPDQVIYVSKNGNDGNEGSEQLPFLTLGSALASITDASPTKRYAIRVSSGTYVEANIALKANVFIVGEVAKEAVRIDSTISMDSSFSGNGDHRSGFANVLILKSADFDWSAVTSSAGKLYFSQTVFGSTVNMYGHNNAIAQAQFADCQFFGKLTISGINVSVFHNNICWGSVDLNQHPNGGMATIFNAVGGTIGGELKLTTTIDDFNRRCSAFLKSCYTSQITIDGVKSYVDATNDSIPSAGATIQNGGNLVQLNSSGLKTDLSNLTYPTAVNQPIIPANTNSTNMGDWGKQWNWNFAFVHASTGSDLYLISYGSSFGADSVGKSIVIIADGAGLQENVDGGNISLSTASVSGTGVRGKILLDGKEIDVSNKQIKNLDDGTDANDAVNKGQLDSLQSQIDSILSNTDPSALDSLSEVVTAFQSADNNLNGAISSLSTSLSEAIDSEESARIAADSTLQSNIDSEEIARANADSDLQNNIDAEKARAESSEAMLEAKLIVAETRIESLESEVQTLQSDQWYTEKFVVDATMIANGFVDLARTPINGSIIGNVDRLSIFEGASEDFSNNGTTITFLNSLVGSDDQALQVGDELRFKYQA